MRCSASSGYGDSNVGEVAGGATFETTIQAPANMRPRAHTERAVNELMRIKRRHAWKFGFSSYRTGTSTLVWRSPQPNRIARDGNFNSGADAVGDTRLSLLRDQTGFARGDDSVFQDWPGEQLSFVCGSFPSRSRMTGQRLGCERRSLISIQRLAGGDMEILTHCDWYLKGGRFDLPPKLIADWDGGGQERRGKKKRKERR
jgi:hypothetical protein